MRKSACLQVIHDLLVTKAVLHDFPILIMFLIGHIWIDLQIQPIALFGKLLYALTHRLQQFMVGIVEQKSSWRIIVTIAAMQLHGHQQRGRRYFPIAADADIMNIPAAQGKLPSGIDRIQKIRVWVYGRKGVIFFLTEFQQCGKSHAYHLPYLLFLILPHPFDTDDTTQ